MIKVDFNEMVEEDLVLLSKSDEVYDAERNKIVLLKGLPISVYEYNEYKNGTTEHISAEGIVEPNDPTVNGRWTKGTKWCCRINANGITEKIT